ncbi:MAG: methyltransferase domain-containing protein [Candidatus Poribacteria bacterium]|nr:methyltransferase domain-containing protein [Candidatus Poribacteria bacterium]
MAFNPRVNYDTIAHLYDGDRYRVKAVDPDLQSFVKERLEAIDALDIACGTGNQMVANRRAFPSMRCVGLDRFAGMLRYGIEKDTDVGWVQGDGATLPFTDDSFDYVSNQYAFHHVGDKIGMLTEVRRVLRLDGRFVMLNLVPERSANWLMYRYFPGVYQRDLADFMTLDMLESETRRAGFENVRIDVLIGQSEDRLRTFAQDARRRVTSQLIVASDEEYAAGIRRIDHDLNEIGDGNDTVPSTICLMKLIAER